MISGNVLEEIELIYQCGSFSKAAEKLGVTQPALSLKVKKLEQELGAQLFDRTSDMSLTTEGKIFLEYVAKRKVLDLDLQNRLVDLQEKVTGTLTVGGTHGFATGYLPLCIAQFSKKYPNVDIRLIEGEMPKIERMSLEGVVDIFVTAVENEDNEFVKEPLFEENIFLCVPEHYADCDDLKDYYITRDDLLCKSSGSDDYKGVSLEKFRHECFILTREKFSVGALSRMLLRNALIYDTVRIIETNQMTTGVALVQHGMGLTFVTEDYIRAIDYMNFPRMLKIKDEGSKRMVYVAYSSKRYLSHAAKAFLEIIRGCNI